MLCEVTLPNTVLKGYRASGGPLLSIDATSDYHTKCQTQLCYIVTFAPDGDLLPIAKGTELSVKFKNLLNPESIEALNAATVTTLLKYPSEADISKYKAAVLAKPWVGFIELLEGYH